MSFTRTLLAFAFALPLLAGTAASTFAADTFTPAQEEAIGKLVDKYVMEHPDLLQRAYEKYQQQQTAKADEAAKKVASSLKDRIKSDELIPVIGNKNGDVLIVEFFDYNCGYCKKALPAVQQVIKEDDKVGVAFVEFPILSPASTDAASYALAASKQGKYWEYHQALMELQEPKTVETLKKVGEKLGLDVAKLETDAKSDAIKKELDDHKKLGTEAGITGTPAFFVNDQISRGYLEPAAMKAAIAQARAAAGTPKSVVKK